VRPLHATHPAQRSRERSHGRVRDMDRLMQV
jgi:hypothetical protein